MVVLSILAVRNAIDNGILTAYLAPVSGSSGNTLSPTGCIHRLVHIAKASKENRTPILNYQWNRDIKCLAAQSFIGTHFVFYAGNEDLDA